MEHHVNLVLGIIVIYSALDAYMYAIVTWGLVPVLVATWIAGRLLTIVAHRHSPPQPKEGSCVT
jgi:uncharacterized membrane protein